MNETILNIIEDGVDLNSPDLVHPNRKDGRWHVLIAEIDKANEIPYSRNGRFYQRRGSESRKLNV